MASPGLLPAPTPTPPPTSSVPVPPIQTNELVGWLSSSWVAIVVFAIVLFLVWRYARPHVNTAVMRILAAQERAMPTGSPEEELVKRAETLEDLVNRLIRFLLVLAVVFVVFGVFDLWPVVAGLGLVLAALTLAGQSVILDYIMGILILVEGQYFKGDTISVGGIEGQVEEVGLRRTVIRDPRGIVHSVSNGTIRVSSNLTRIFAVAMVDIEGVRNTDVEAVIAMMDQVGRELAADPEWAELIVEAPGYRSTPAFTDIGVTLRMTGKVRTQGRWTVPAELRRRLAVSMSAAGIHLDRRTVAASQPHPARDDVTGTGGGSPRP